MQRLRSRHRWLTLVVGLVLLGTSVPGWAQDRPRDAGPDQAAEADATISGPRTPAWIGTTKELGTRAPATAVRIRIDRGRLRLDVPDVSEFHDTPRVWDGRLG
jgi:hypothetical protein